MSTSNEFRRIASHEAGHFVCAANWGIPSYPEITLNGLSAVATEEVPYPGICHVQQPIPPLQMAAISWAGVLAECMAGCGQAWTPPFKPAADTLKDWHSMALHQLHRFSESDRRGILACYRKSFRACKIAFGILQRNPLRLKKLTALLVKAEEKRKAAGEAAFKERIQEMLNEPLPESAYRAKWNLGDETTS